MLRVDRVRTPPGSLKSRSARYFSVKHAYLAEVTRPEVVSTALEALIKLGAVRTAKDTYAIKAGTEQDAGTVLAGLSGKHLFFANDEEALKAALAAVASVAPAPMEHGADAFVDPALLSRAFNQVSLLDLMSSRDLAPLVAAGTELGPLLSHTERLSAWVDADGTSQRYALTWKLSVPAGEADASSDAGAAPH
jgi:hypothetical protein